MNTNPIYAANLVVMQASLEALRFHTQRLRDASLNAGSSTVAEHRIIEACQLAEYVLNAIDTLPALLACKEVAL